MSQRSDIEPGRAERKQRMRMTQKRLLNKVVIFVFFLRTKSILVTS